jgi:hypothetical protein
MDMNVDVLAKHLHKDFRRSIHPRSLNLPEQNKEEWIKEITGIMSFTTEFEVIYTPSDAITHSPS